MYKCVYYYVFLCSVVSVGYEYSSCKRIFWDKQATTLSGFLGGDLGSSDRSVAKGWSLDIQHFYNYHEGKYNINKTTIGVSTIKL